MKCRLMYLVGQLGSGGLERQLYYLLKTIDRDKYRPAVVVWNYHDDDVYVAPIRALGVPLYRVKEGRRAFRLVELHRLVRTLAPEVIHSFSFYTNVAAWWAAKATTTIPVGGLRGDFQRAKRESGVLLGRLSARWPRYQISNNVAGAETINRRRSIFAPKATAIVRNGLDLRAFRSTVLPSGKIHFIGVGSLIAVKRWDRLLRAAGTLKRQGFDFQVTIVGGGPLRGALERQAAAIGVAERVQFVGHSENVSGLLAGASCLVHTSDSEGCPNVVMEAMACARAVVATDVGDVPHLIDEGKTGFVVPRDDDAQLADRLLRLIRDRELCRHMGEAGRAKAETEFGLDRLVEQTLDAYRLAGWDDANSNVNTSNDHIAWEDHSQIAVR